MEALPDSSQIKILRKSLNISQKELGERLSISQSTISRIENGTMDPPYSKFKLIYEFLENERMARKRSIKHAIDILTPEIIFINPHSTVKETVELMTKYNISQVPILENQQNYGSITSKRIQKYITDDPVILNLKVTDIKELPFPEVEKNWNVKDISSLLISYPAVLVKEDKKFIGIITDANFLKLTSK
ncbi:MAG: helix-turn-helix domain-containing protein [Candidatus Lokiarchaeota archaeon]|nr:helix-turn-helix domain-containing protein [Candidatus Lokiarchaeota archaeon]